MKMQKMNEMHMERMKAKEEKAKKRSKASIYFIIIYNVSNSLCQMYHNFHALYRFSQTLFDCIAVAKRRMITTWSAAELT